MRTSVGKPVARARRIRKVSGTGVPARLKPWHRGTALDFHPLGSITPRSGLGTGNYFSSPGMQGEFRAGLSRHSQAPDFGYPASFRLPNCSSGGGSDAGNTGCPQLRPAGADTACGTPRCPPGSSAEPLQTAEPSLGLGSRLDRGKAAGRELPPLRARLRVPSARHSGF